MVAKRGIAAAMALVLFVLATSCGKRRPAAAAPRKPAMKPAPPTPIDVKRAELGGPMWHPAWDKVVEEALPPELLSTRVARDVRPFCPRFPEMSKADKREFWAYFFQALAGAEGGLKPTSRALHAQPQMEVRDPVTGVQEPTEGLLQLAYGDAERYGCNFDWKADRKLPAGDPARTILQPKNNLDCGVRILDRELIVEHKPLLSRTQYWSTLRPGTLSYHVFARQMANVPAACGLRKTPRRKPLPTQRELISSAR